MVNGKRDKARAVASNSLSVKRSGKSSHCGRWTRNRWTKMGRAAPHRPSPPILSAHRDGRAFRAIRTCGWNNDDHPGKRSVFAVIYTPLLFVPVVVVFTFEMYKLLERERESWILPPKYIYLRTVVECNARWLHSCLSSPLSGRPTFSPPFPLFVFEDRCVRAGFSSSR